MTTTKHQPVVGLCYGVWDVLHPGHVAHLTEARAHCDTLIVGVSADEVVRKGPDRPCFALEQRAGHLAALRMVDRVEVIRDPTAVGLIERLKPDIVFRGDEYRNHLRGAFALERAAVEAYGGKVVFTEGFTASSSAIINGHIAPVPDAVREVKERHGEAGVLGWLGRAEGLRAFALGEPITDHYVYVEPAGKSPKENLVTYVHGGEDIYEGGVWAVASHLREACALAGHSGGWMSPIVKRRFVQKAFMAKVFSEAVLPADRGHQGLDYDALRHTDLVVMADYGHGIVHTPEEAAEVSKACKFLALTVQSNSLNWGFNLLTKYPHADYVVVDEMELRLACGSRNGHLQGLVQAQARRMSTKLFAVTMGHRGCLAYDGQGFTEMPSLAGRVVDRMGAGDAFLAWTAPLAAIGAPREVVAIVGNVAAGLKVSMAGNPPVTASDVRRVVKAVLK